MYIYIIHICMYVFVYTYIYTSSIRVMSSRDMDTANKLHMLPRSHVGMPSSTTAHLRMTHASEK